MIVLSTPGEPSLGALFVLEAHWGRFKYQTYGIFGMAVMHQAKCNVYLAYCNIVSEP
jgi:hypothetical protein